MRKKPKDSRRFCYTVLLVIFMWLLVRNALACVPLGFLFDDPVICKQRDDKHKWKFGIEVPRITSKL